tara:strand:- start:46 stop:756 length:711 start_codon:yes stop_codon:yes gene_type:complete
MTCDSCSREAPKGSLFNCSQCNSTWYCNQKCQRDHWKAGGHGKLCKRIAIDKVLAAEKVKKAAGEEPGPRVRPTAARDQWSWHSTPEAVASRPKFTLDQVTVALDQDPDPRYDGMTTYTPYWDDLQFVIKEGTPALFSGSIIPPTVKKILQVGLRDKRLSWEYLTKGCGPFLLLLAHDAVRNSDKELVCEWIVRADPKPDAGLLLEQLTECFWRTVTSPGTPEYSQKHVDVLKANK